MKKQRRKGILTLALAVLCCFVLQENVLIAQGYDDSWYDSWYDDDDDWYDDWYDTDDNGWDSSSELYEGDTQEESLSVYYGEKGVLPSPGSWTDHTGVTYTIATSEYTLTEVWSNVLTLDERGNYEVIGIGTTEAKGRFYDASGRLLLTKTYLISAKVDMSGVTLDKTSATNYAQKGYYFVSSRFEFHLKSENQSLPASAYDYELSSSSSNPDIYVDAYMGENDTVIIDTTGAGKTTVTLVINEKTFELTLHVIEVGINKNSLLLAAGQSSQLKLSGLSKGIKWSSSKPSVVKVTSNGKVKALKNGNAVIKAKVGDMTLGCAVSVVSQNRYKTIKKAISIGKTCVYSQPKRMQKGYYDCSSLTWSAYKLSGINFGNAGYAPVAASQAQWCVQKKKNIKGGLTESNIKNMKLNAGDLMFESGSDNGRYRNIYHVEMISGYTCYGFDEQGKPLLGIKWANRPDDYYWCAGQLVCRP